MSAAFVELVRFNLSVRNSIDRRRWTAHTLHEETELEKGYMSILSFNEPGQSP